MTAKDREDRKGGAEEQACENQLFGRPADDREIRRTYICQPRIRASLRVGIERLTPQRLLRAG